MSTPCDFMNCFLHLFLFISILEYFLCSSFLIISSSHLLLGLALFLFPSTFPCIITFFKLLSVLKMCLQYFSLPRSMILRSDMWSCICSRTQSFIFWQSMESLIAVSKSTYRMHSVSADPPYVVSDFRCHMSLLGTQGNKPVLFLWLQICSHLSLFLPV